MVRARPVPTATTKSANSTMWKIKSWCGPQGATLRRTASPALLSYVANHPGIFKRLIIGGGGTNHTDIGGILDELVNARRSEPYENLTGRACARLSECLAAPRKAPARNSMCLARLSPAGMILTCRHRMRKGCEEACGRAIWTLSIAATSCGNSSGWFPYGNLNGCVSNAQAQFRSWSKSPLSIGYGCQASAFTTLRARMNAASIGRGASALRLCKKQRCSTTRRLSRPL